MYHDSFTETDNIIHQNDENLQYDIVMKLNLQNIHPSQLHRQQISEFCCC